MASKNPPGRWKKSGLEPIVAESDRCDPKFLDDLVAAIRLKACLIGRGVEINDKTLDALAEFHSRFSEEITAYDKALEAADAAQFQSEGVSPSLEAQERETRA